MSSEHPIAPSTFSHGARPCHWVHRIELEPNCLEIDQLSSAGYIGLPAAEALVRAGHTVYATSRTDATSNRLRASEIIPVGYDPQSWKTIISYLDVIIDCMGGKDLNTRSAALFEEVTSLANETRAPGSANLTYIYTSGTWVHGEDRERIVTDTTPLGNTPSIVAWRPTLEQRVTKSPTLNGIVLRPALLYGRSGSLFTPLFTSASEGKVVWYSKPGGRLSLIHIDDLADLYVRIVERAPVLGGLTFDAANDFTESVEDLLTKLVNLSGAQSYELLEPSDAYLVALSTTHLLRPYLAKSLLGWQPKKLGLVDGLGVYYAAWKAAQ